MIFERLATSENETKAALHAHLEEYASFGYRTLCFAAVDLDQVSSVKDTIEVLSFVGPIREVVRGLQEGLPSH